MTDLQGLHFELNLRLLICKVHGTALHPEQEAIKRHLRGEGHFCKGRLLKETVSALGQLALQSKQALVNWHSHLAAQPINAIPHLTVYPGWSCIQCSGAELTMSEEVRDRHVAKVHKQRPSNHSDRKPLWEACDLQTLFIKTGDRHYFRVIRNSSLTGDGDLPDSNQGDISHTIDGESQAQEFLDRVNEQRKDNLAITIATTDINPDPTAQNTTDELWMKKLGVRRYIAGSCIERSHSNLFTCSRPSLLTNAHDQVGRPPTIMLARLLSRSTGTNTSPSSRTIFTAVVLVLILWKLHQRRSSHIGSDCSQHWRTREWVFAP
jgi:hypothetical protein